MSSQPNFGSFVPETNVWDFQQINDLDIDPNFKELLVRLYQNINLISIVLNTKDTGIYTNLEEFVNGQQYFPNPALDSTTPQSPTMRQVFRTVINFGALPNATSKSVAHNIIIGTTFSLTRFYASATNTALTSFIPIPYSSVSSINNNIELSMDATDVTITTGVDQTDYTTCYVIIEYIKQ